MFWVAQTVGLIVVARAKAEEPSAEPKRSNEIAGGASSTRRLTENLEL
jgi:hypothetical protein